MRKLNYFLIAPLLFVLIACSPKAAESAPAADSTAVAADYAMPDSATISSVAAKENPADKTHKFVRTANLHFRVNNVVHSTYQIEDAVGRMGGFVSRTELRTDIQAKESSRISNDSVVETTRFTVFNSMTIRVPNTKLDSTLKLIAKTIEFLDSRTIKADDISLQLLANQLSWKRSTKNQSRITHAIDTKGKKLSETTQAEESLTNKEEQSDNAFINNLSLNDQVNYSTIEIEMYQRPSVKYEVYAELEKDSRFEQGLFSQLAESLQTGWSIAKAVIAFIFKMWGIIALIVLGFLVHRYIRRK